MDTVTRVWIQDKVVCISHSAKILGKGMNPTILSPSLNIVEQLGVFNHGTATGLGKGKQWIETC